MKEDDASWPEPDRVGRQELEVVIGNEHISFCTSKIGAPSAAPLLGGRLLFVLCPPPSFQRLRCTHDDICHCSTASRLKRHPRSSPRAGAVSDCPHLPRAQARCWMCSRARTPRACVCFTTSSRRAQTAHTSPPGGSSLPGVAARQCCAPGCFPSLAPPPTAISFQDLKCFVFSLIGLHFKIKPI